MKSKTLKFRNGEESNVVKLRNNKTENFDKIDVVEVKKEVNGIINLVKNRKFSKDVQ